MKVVVLGAAGAMGRVAAMQLSKNERIEELVLADLDPGDLDPATLRNAGGRGVSLEACDVLDATAIRRLLEPADVVVNCSGPFFRLGVPALRAAIDTGTTYLDICDDPDPTIEMMQLDADARAAGVTAVIGMGASPGISNLLAVRASRRLDAVQDCFTAWSLDDSRESTGSSREADGLVRADGSPSGAVVHFMEQIHGAVAVVEDGELVRRAPLEAIELDYPGVGSGTGYVVGHPEPVTLHRSLGVTGRSCNLVLVDDGATIAFLRGLQRDLDAGRLTLDQAARAMLTPPASRSAKAAISGLRLRGGGGLPRLFALVRGSAAGRPAVVGCHVTAMPSGMAGATSIPAALATAQLLERPRAAGVHAPEAVIDADRLLADLAPLCEHPVDGLEALAPVVVATS